MVNNAPVGTTGSGAGQRHDEAEALVARLVDAWFAARFRTEREVRLWRLYQRANRRRARRVGAVVREERAARGEGQG